ncbi:ferrochelatase [Aquifex aeolicus]
MRMKKGVILINLGGPDSLEAVEPFLYNLFSDPDIFSLPFQKVLAKIIAKLRAKKTRHYYELMGGKSPQYEQTLEQAKALQERLGEDYKVVVGMRYWKPYIKDALSELLKEGINEVILLPLYPQYSKTTTGSAFNEFERSKKALKADHIKVKKIEHFYDHPLYIKAWAEQIKQSVEKPEEYHFLFSAHSLPKKLIEEGDPYQEQTEKTVKLIMENFPEVEYTLAYQSKVGFGKWLEPSTDEVIRNLIKKEVKKLLVIPISFVSEHSETLYELDKQYRELAQELGYEEFVRVPTLRTNPYFISALEDLVKNEV